MAGKNTNRDDFNEKTKRQIAKRAGWLCSFPECGKQTVGGDVNIGTAAHICAAAPGGPRYDPRMTPDERRSEKNGIWMCRNHGTAIDSDDPQFTVQVLLQWKAEAERKALRDVLNHVPPPATAPAQVAAALANRFRVAADADIKNFRRRGKWSGTTIPLRVRVEGLAESISTDALGEVAIENGDLLLIAGPGAGKTTSMLQIAGGVLASNTGTPILVLLGEWQTQQKTIVESICARVPFRDISAQDFFAAAAEPGVLLLLDGWNELDAGGRTRAGIEIDELKAQLPDLALVVSSRKQDQRLPFNGRQVGLLPLSDKQQLELARGLRGDRGKDLLDRARRTPGVRELVSVPLYLKALMSLPDDLPFPKTKDEVLRHFVAAHQNDLLHAERLRAVLRGVSEHYLADLAQLATSTSNTAITDTNARKSITATATKLLGEGQIANRPEPGEVLDVLVGYHLLMRTGDALAVSFQHQQIQEWFASYFIQDRILAELDDPAARERLKSEVFNRPAWEEAILFATERMSRGDAHQCANCGRAILSAFEVDPILSADMIFRATDDVWNAIAPAIHELVGRWHAPGAVDSAFRFMLTTGRPEFLAKVWSLLVDENDQVSFNAIRNCSRFRPSILGPDAVNRIKALPSKPREVILHEIAMTGGIDGLELAAEIAMSEPDPKIQASVLDALAFRRAERQIDEVLRVAGSKTYDLVVQKGFIEVSEDPVVQAGLHDARMRQEAGGLTEYARLYAIIHAESPADRSTDLEALVAKMQMKREDAQPLGGLLHKALKRYPTAVAHGLLRRIRSGSEIIWGTDDLLALSGTSLDDDELLAIALEPGGFRDSRAEAAASVLGPHSVGKLLDAYLLIHDRRHPKGKNAEAIEDWPSVLRTRIGHTPGSSLVNAIAARAGDASPGNISEMAELLNRRDNEGPRGRPFSADARATMVELIRDWADRLLSMGDQAKRRHLASLAWLAARCPSVELLPILKRLLNEELRRLKYFQDQALASSYRDQDALHESRMHCDNVYQDAFLEIVAPETTALMRDYLTEELFGGRAAIVMKLHWIMRNEPKRAKDGVFGPPEFAGLEEKRGAFAQNPAATCEEAEAIFHAIENLTADGATEGQKKLAHQLAIQVARLPYGKRRDTMKRLLAAIPQRVRATLVHNLVMSGQIVSFDIVRQGIDDFFEEAKKHPWVLSEGYQLKAWLKLLPFTDRPACMLDIVRILSGTQREPDFLEDMIKSTEFTGSPEVDDALFALAEDNPKFYCNRAWRNAVLGRKTLSAAKRFVELVLEGTIQSDRHGSWYLAQEIGGLLRAHAELRRYAHVTLKQGTHPRLDILIQAIDEAIDPEGLVLLVELENKLQKRLVSKRAIENAVTVHAASQEWNGATVIVPKPAAELRARLLAMTTDGGKSDAAARTLRAIQKFREDIGTPDDEPRHPHLESGKPWPILTHDPDATNR